MGDFTQLTYNEKRPYINKYDNPNDDQEYFLFVFDIKEYPYDFWKWTNTTEIAVEDEDKYQERMQGTTQKSDWS